MNSILNESLAKVFLGCMFALLTIITIGCRTAKKKHNYIERAYLELRDSFPDAEVKILEDSIKLIFPDHIMFGLDSHQLLSPFLRKLARLSIIFNKFDKTNMLITGHTDNTGEETHNQTLSELRAASVKKQIVANKVDGSRIFTWGLGQKSPTSENKSEAGRAKNRRVEFIILYNTN
jgi:outer membrane protein OmpA-like peptidoglycan-associated protein